MIATPIIPGRIYRVTHRGTSLIVIAPDGCTAIVICLPRFIDEHAGHDATGMSCAA